MSLAGFPLEPAAGLQEPHSLVKCRRPVFLGQYWELVEKPLVENLLRNIVTYGDVHPWRFHHSLPIIPQLSPPMEIGMGQSIWRSDE